jgi:hypothetical protein
VNEVAAFPPTKTVPKRAELVPRLPVVQEEVALLATSIVPTPLVVVVVSPTSATPFATVAVPVEVPVKTGALLEVTGVVSPWAIGVAAANATLETDPPKRAQIATEIALPLNLTILKPVSF